MVVGSNDNIKIKLVLMNGDEPRYVEYYSVSDSRNSIINAKTFVDVFGVSMDELRAFNKVRYEKEQ